MKKYILLIINLSSILIGVFFGLLWITRFKYDYNSEGKYFDELNLITYDQDALFVYGILALIFLIIGIVSSLILIKQKNLTGKLFKFAELEF